MAAGRLVGVALLFGLFVSLSCGGRSLSRDEGGEAGAGGGGGASGSGGSSDPRGGANASGGNAGTSSGGSGPGSGGDGPTSGGSGPSGGGNSSGTGARAGCSAGGDIPLVPSEEGWIEFLNDFQCGIHLQGSWYPFGDQYPGPNDSKCITVGHHSPEECSIVHSPPPYPAVGFSQTVRGEMCTSGEVAMVLPCPPEIMSPGCPMADYLNMTGAGIAVDFNADKPENGGQRYPWDPADHGIIGFSFEIDQLPQSLLRVEIPMLLTDEEAARFSLRAGATTDEHPDGSPYWGASNRYPPSPVALGVNRVLFTDIRAPRDDENYVFDTRRMLGIQFHVPTNTMSKAEYAFCIKNLTLLRQ